MTLPPARTPANLTGPPVPAPGRLSQTTGIRIAMFGVAAPFLCCAAGLTVQALLRHHQSALAADYAARHMAPFPGVVGYAGEPSSFLLGTAPGAAIIARNPAQWSMDIAMVSYLLTPMLIIAGALLVYGLAARHRGVIVGAVFPILGLAWYSDAPVALITGGRELVLDGPADSLVLNGRKLAALSDIAGFAGRVLHHPRGGDDFTLSAVLRDRRAIALQGADARPDIVDAAEPLSALLVQMRESARGAVHPSRP